MRLKSAKCVEPSPNANTAVRRTPNKSVPSILFDPPLEKHRGLLLRHVTSRHVSPVNMLSGRASFTNISSLSPSGVLRMVTAPPAPICQTSCPSSPPS